MALAAVMSPAAYLAVSPSCDSSMGSIGFALREAIERAEEPALDRTPEMVRRVSEALMTASVEHGLLVDRDVVAKVFAFLEGLPSSIELPGVVVESGNEVGLDWDFANDAVVSVTIDSTQRLGYSAVIGSEAAYGYVPLCTGLPEVVQGLVRRAERRRTAS